MVLSWLLAMTLSGCQHLQKIKAEKGLDSYKILHACFISCKTEDARRRKVTIFVTMSVCSVKQWNIKERSFSQIARDICVLFNQNEVFAYYFIFHVVKLSVICSNKWVATPFSHTCVIVILNNMNEWIILWCNQL